MRLTVLVDNATLIDRYFKAEPALCLHIEADGKNILFDCGYSDLLVENARKLGISLANLDYVILSHGHLDHTWGLTALIRHMTELRLENRPCKRPTLIAHPLALTSVRLDPCPEIGSMLDHAQLARHFDLQLQATPVSLGANLHFLGEIPRNYLFERAAGIGVKDGEQEADVVPDDSALAYRGQEGLVVITGCSHAGICNIVDHAMAVTGENRLADIIGGLHLLEAPADRLSATVGYLQKTAPNMLSPCHCTDLNAKIALSSVTLLREVGVGLVIDYR